jgi:two-component SAPR family response regulator
VQQPKDTHPRGGETAGLTSTELELLGRVACALDPTDDLSAGVPAALRILCEALGAAKGQVLLAEPRGGDLLLFAEFGGGGRITRHTDTRDTGTRDTGTRDTGTRDTGTRDTDTRDTEGAARPEGEVQRVTVSIPGARRELGQLCFWKLGGAGDSVLLAQVARAMGVVLQARFAALRAEIRRAIDAGGSAGCLASALQALRALTGAESGELHFQREGEQGFRQVSSGSVDVACPYAGEPTRCPVVCAGHVSLFQAGRGEPPQRCRALRPAGDRLCLPLHSDSGARGRVLLALGWPRPALSARDLVPLLEQVDEAAAVLAQRPGVDHQRADTRPIEIRCLGAFELSCRGQAVVASRFTRAKAWELLKHLALCTDQPVDQEVLVRALWPDAGPKAGANRLHGVVHALRQVLDAERGEPSCVLRVRGGYMLDPDRVRIDVVEFRRWLREARRLARGSETLAAVDAYGAAIDLYRGDLFAESLSADGSHTERVGLQRRLLDACQNVGALCVRADVPASAVPALRRGLAVDPFREDMQRQLVEILLGLGRRREAREQLQACMGALRRGLDAEPQPETLALWERVRGE